MPSLVAVLPWLPAEARRHSSFKRRPVAAEGAARVFDPLRVLIPCVGGARGQPFNRSAMLVVVLLVVREFFNPTPIPTDGVRTAKCAAYEMFNEF